MTSERSDGEKPASGRAVRRKAPQSIAELIGRLEEFSVAPKRPVPTMVLRLFAAKRPMPTSERERETLRELLGPLDPTWSLRAAIVASGAPERLVESSASLASLLTREARAETGYPAEGTEAELVDWATAVTSSKTDRARSMPAVALAALWSDRRREGAALAVARIVLGTQTRASGGKASAGPAEVTMRGLLDPTRGSRVLAAYRWILIPGEAESSRLRTELAENRMQATALGRRSDALQREVHDLSERLTSALGALDEAAMSRRVAEEAAAAAEERRIREVQETAGAAMHERSAMARDYAGDMSRLAEEVIGYLDRAVPNVNGALRRAREIGTLARELEEER